MKPLCIFIFQRKGKGREKMKAIIRKLTVLCLILTVTFCLAGSAQAAGKVSYTLKSGTLTVRGNGAMPSSMKFKNNAKIKKVVIKNGVTSVSNGAFQKCPNLTKVTIGDSVKNIGKKAFYNCKKLKTLKIGKNVTTIGDSAFAGTAVKSVTLPKKVNTIGLGVFFNCKNLKTLTLPGNIKNVTVPDPEERYPGTPKPRPNNPVFSDTVETINFSTALNLDFTPYCFAKNFNVSKNDKKFKSIDGVIYSKDGKTLVRVPERTELTVADGCENFLVDSVLYSKRLGEDSFINHCTQLTKITMPASVRKVTKDRPVFGDILLDSLCPIKFEIRNKSLPMDSIVTLIHAFHWFEDDEDVRFSNKNNAIVTSIVENFPDRIQKDASGLFYITTDGLLLRYLGTTPKPTIPDSVKTIDEEYAIPCWLE